ncbi:SDR family oxidoreductase [Rhodococcus sp. BP-252]|uniref:SDR family NAD(P)-dependent oxidoreductase n=1 Tax=unclassified Rhodococcus (in: high G+C Gram-positive bacteria) TaxID=192944 RepID=UPI001C9AB659|nr:MULTISPECIES: SDR family oxidoreductase [unclassified Rhodococcus (in: high G+C Gram-positive bacteria)]MBY6412824.1 SDR family oxidoreductase [Rhodococcus sp. BP-320]MBY6417639.1 SDR family oxidoreductase [Rhodococcus sp. BP-321]MBY6423491.1 SDR family oxidoreductase [Rhodococcus sp. BP-324]MBY6427663.1 SDR family oxidoreductase [Rhodococcus sp. BP-323]MBY6432827.1 SDR family oxidoreductase [Rhodococcus sp. BP-322]
MSTFSSNLFAGKTAVVTGGTSGLGAETARYLAELGAKVYAVGLGSDEVQVPDHLDMVTREVDVTDDNQLQSLYSEIDSLDILMPAAGITLGSRELEWESFNRVLSIQLSSVYRTIQLGHELLARSNGSIITVASMFSFFGGGTRAAYSAAKGGIVQLTRSLAEAYAPDQIRVNAIAPGWIDTPLLTPLKEDEALNERILSRTPMGRYGNPREIAEVTAFLASDAASFITGVVLPVDGGYLVAGI